MQHRILIEWLRRPRFVGAALLIVASGLIYLCYFTPEKRIVRQYLAEADDKSAQAIHLWMFPVREVFDKGRRGSKFFASEALSWSGKFALLKGMLYLGPSKEAYLTEIFHRNVLSEEELRQAMESAVQGYLTEQGDIEAEMLVGLRADLVNLDPTAPLLQSDLVFRQEYARLSQEVAKTLQIDMGVEVGMLVASEVIVQAAVQALGTQAGNQAGLLGAGAASSVATLGVGFVVAILVDEVLSAVLKEAGYDPEAKIAGQVETSLNNMERALTAEGGGFFFFGTEDGTLRAQRKKLHEDRSTIRRQAIHQALAGDQ